METNPVPAAGPKNNRNTIIYVIGAVLLCCCCVATAVGGYYGYQAYIAAQQVAQDIQDFEIPTDVPFVPLDPNGDPTIPGIDLSGEVPSGGLADDETRFVAWSLVQGFGLASGCTGANAAGTTITVTQEPDASGVWKEEWNVDCGDGSFKAFPLTFTPSNGVVNVEVGFAP